jgi:hypothetical protein
MAKSLNKCITSHACLFFFACVCVCVCVLWEHLEIYPQAGGVAQTVRVQGPQFKFQCAKKKERKKERNLLSQQFSSTQYIAINCSNHDVHYISFFFN